MIRALSAEKPVIKSFINVRSISTVRAENANWRFANTVNSPAVNDFRTGHVIRVGTLILKGLFLELNIV